MNSELYNSIFDRSISDYHKSDNIDTPINNPHPEGSLENLLYLKNWIDTVQWHLEDVIRRPDLPAQEFIEVKRRIDRSNQERTDTVERIDDYFLEIFNSIKAQPEARLNTETPAWVIDRLSILALKIYHMREQTERSDADEKHLATCRQKLDILLEQRVDLSRSLDELFEDIKSGRRYMKVYRQMKMYNDSTLNPQLYRKK